MDGLPVVLKVELHSLVQEGSKPSLTIPQSAEQRSWNLACVRHVKTDNPDSRRLPKYKIRCFRVSHYICLSCNEPPEYDTASVKQPFEQTCAALAYRQD